MNGCRAGIVKGKILIHFLGRTFFRFAFFVFYICLRRLLSCRDTRKKQRKSLASREGLLKGFSVFTSVNRPRLPAWFPPFRVFHTPLPHTHNTHHQPRNGPPHLWVTLKFRMNAS